MSIFLQADSLAVANQVLSEDAQPVEQTLSIWSLLTSGGAGGIAIMIVLFLLLFMALFLYFERIMAINKASKIDASFMNNIKLHISSGKIDAAKMLCAQTNSPVARLIEKGISRIGKPLEDINTAIENAGNLHKMASGGGQIEVGALAEGIYTAMTTTVVGLVVGIIAYMGYNHLVVKTNKIVNQMEANAVEFLDLLNEPV